MRRVEITSLAVCFHGALRELGTRLRHEYELVLVGFPSRRGTAAAAAEAGTAAGTLSPHAGRERRAQHRN